MTTTVHHIVEFPAKYGGGTVKFRELPLAVERRIRSAHAKSGDMAAMGDELVSACIVAVSADLANVAGFNNYNVADSDHPHLVTVNDVPPGRAEIWAALGIHRRRLLDAAWVKTHSVDEEDIAPFLESIQTVV